MSHAPEPSTAIGRRIIVIGTTGSGKTTMARRLAGMLGVPHIELDTLHWEPGWHEAPRDVFRARVAAAVAADGWATCGNYSAVRDLTWPRADTVVWLDFSMPVNFFRLFRRTIRRLITRETVCNGNVETFRGQFLSTDSLFVWLFQTYRRRRREYPAQLALPEHAHLRLVRLRSPREAERWVRAVGGVGRLPTGHQ